MGEPIIFSVFNLVFFSLSRYKNPYAARLIAFLLYGGEALKARHASHLCGNCACLHPAHIYPELAHENYSRDNHHAVGVFGAACNHNPKCLKCEFKQRVK